jgi:hypothetical protein
MKLTSVLFFSLLLTASHLFAQMSGMMTMQSSAPQGTTLGANTTSGAAGIALGNRVVMRGFIDFQFKYDDEDVNTPKSQTEAFNTKSDVDFLFDFSPITGEVHLRATTKKIDLEQAFGRYSVNRDFNFSFGRQLTALGYESDEQPGLFAVSNAYYLGDKAASGQTRRNYKDGVRANFNNGRFGLTAGLHDGYWSGDDFNGDNIALDISASLMIIPGLEARLGYAHEEVDQGSQKSKDISQFNAWLGYNPGDLTLAFEFDNFDILDDEYWSMMLLANYQFVEWMGATIRYSHEDYDNGPDHDADRFSFALLFSLTQNFGLNFEYSTTSVDSAKFGDYDEFYVEGLITF